MWSMTAIAVAAWLGAAVDTRGSAYSLWHLGFAALAVAFNLGSFVVEYTVIVAHVRLLTELKDRADRLREERYGPDAAASNEPPGLPSGAAEGQPGYAGLKRCARLSPSEQPDLAQVELRRIQRADDAARGYRARGAGGFARLHAGHATSGALWPINMDSMTGRSAFCSPLIRSASSWPARFWVGLSDRYGRRPVLIFSQAGTALSFLILGLSRDFSVMLLARMLDGASGGNILVAQAYVADVTAPEHRARGMGLIGMAFGIGFVLGPLLGGLLLGVPLPAEWRLRLPFLVAAAFSTLAWVLVFFRLPESRPAA